MDNGNVSRNIKALREKHGFGQAALAKFLGVDQSLISKIESGERFASAEMLEKLADLFAIKVGDLGNDEIPDIKFVYGFRGKEFTFDDMQAVAVINRIALNSKEMGEMLENEKQPDV